MRRRRGRVAGLAVLLAVLAGAVAVIELAGRGDGGVVERPIDPRQQTALAFGERSHWLQPWRAYLDTVPADRLRNAIGINFNVSEAEAPGTARMLAESGFRRARLEIGWSSIAYADTSQLRRPAYLRQMLGALRDNGIRPLILLNANHNYPADPLLRHYGHPSRAAGRAHGATRCGERRARDTEAHRAQPLRWESGGRHLHSGSS